MGSDGAMEAVSFAFLSPLQFLHLPIVNIVNKRLNYNEKQVARLRTVCIKYGLASLPIVMFN